MSSTLPARPELYTKSYEYAANAFLMSFKYGVQRLIAVSSGCPNAYLKSAQFAENIRDHQE